MTCPECGTQDGELSVAGQHWAYCERHKIRWWSGNRPNRKYEPEQWTANRHFLTGFRDVTPLTQVML